MKTIKGKAWTFRDLVDTDIIVPHAYLTASDPEEQVKHAFESIYKDFYKKVQPGDIIVAGKNFGTGSSREEAVFVLKQMGIPVVVADSIARIYFRNLINLGILAIQIPKISKEVKKGDILTIDCEQGKLTNESAGKAFTFPPLSEYILNLIKSGGTINYLKNRLGKH